MLAAFYGVLDTKIEAYGSAQMATIMQVHIGRLIREELRRQGHTNQWLSDQIGITPRTLQKIFNKPSIDTQQLLIISRALGVDLFYHYSNALNLSVTNIHSNMSNVVTCPYPTPQD